MESTQFITKDGLPYDDLTPEQALQELKQLEHDLENEQAEEEFRNSIQLALKLLMNGEYGAQGNKWYSCHCPYVAAAITAMGRSATQRMVKDIEEYFYDRWHLDVDLHKLLGIKVTGPIDDGFIDRMTNKKVDYHVWDCLPDKQKYQILDDNAMRYIRRKPVAIYGDTDSVSSNSVISTQDGDFTFSELWEWMKEQKYLKVIENNPSGHEVMHLYGFKTLNWSKKKGVYSAPVSKLVRHNVSKKRYKITTRSGKSVEVTSDHSLVVFRGNKQVVVKPYEIQPMDKVVVIP